MQLLAFETVGIKDAKGCFCCDQLGLEMLTLPNAHFTSYFAGLDLKGQSWAMLLHSKMFWGVRAFLSALQPGCVCMPYSQGPCLCKPLSVLC